MVMSNLHNGPVGIFESHGDVGPVLNAGSILYSKDSQEYRIGGSGTNMWFAHDEFHFAWKQLQGDFILRAQVSFEGEGVDAHRQIGLMIRKDQSTDSPYVDAAVHGDGLTSMQFRKVAHANTEEQKSMMKAPDIVELSRVGGVFHMRVAHFGEVFQEETLSGIDLGDRVYAGIFITSHNPDVVERATFSNVRIVVPAKPDFVPYKDYLGSKLEILDVGSGQAKIIFETEKNIEAPNWTHDGKFLIYNSGGKLYRFPLRTGKPEPINTGKADRLNNDHVLSADGKQIGISHNAREIGKGSLIYTMPITGGEPKQITTDGPSYLHGWSPDGKLLSYTGGRSGAMDIFTIPASGGTETRLTTAPGLNDGSEFSPDGKHIYFNSSRSGTMQLYRMKVDGSEQTQLTNDAFNNWFPHISPDGKWIAFITFGHEISPTDHPYYKHVYLRFMRVSGGEPKVIAYLYGGQGTINVPSWSPDSKKLAFVSHTGPVN